MAWDAGDEKIWSVTEGEGPFQLGWAALRRPGSGDSRSWQCVERPGEAAEAKKPPPVDESEVMQCGGYRVMRKC
jgi:hypothetical protein